MGVRNLFFESNLKSEKSKSCGCWAKEKASRPRIDDTNPALRRLIHSYRFNAKSRGLEWNLTIKQCEVIFQENCFYCGAEPSKVRKTGINHFVYNGIDRKDNTKGHDIGNVVSCCFICNRAKSVLTVEEFLEWIERVNTYQRS